MEFSGVIIGVVSFIIIGVFHPIVVKCEYYFGRRAWPVFFAAGVAAAALSVKVSDVFLSAILGVLGCTFFWSIKELKEQEERVKKGWFPRNPKKLPPKD